MKIILILYLIMFVFYKFITIFLKDSKSDLVVKFIIFLLGPVYTIPKSFFIKIVDGQCVRSRRKTFLFLEFLGSLPWYLTFSLRAHSAYAIKKTLFSEFGMYVSKETIDKNDWYDLLDLLNTMAKFALVTGLQNIISMYVSKPDKHLYAEIFMDLDTIIDRTDGSVKATQVWKDRESLFSKIFPREYYGYKNYLLS